MTASPLNELRFRIEAHLAYLYPETDNAILADQIIEIMDYANHCYEATQFQNHWDQNDIAVITYGNTVKNTGEVPLKTLSNFLHNYLSELISIVHILPFYPFSSDDGFSVIDYSAVNTELGTWEDIQALTNKFKLMADLVINHCSAESEWFKNFSNDKSPRLTPPAVKSTSGAPLVPIRLTSTLKIQMFCWNLYASSHSTYAGALKFSASML